MTKNERDKILKGIQVLWENCLITCDEKEELEKRYKFREERKNKEEEAKC